MKVCCPVCTKWFTRKEDKYFCSRECRIEAFAILDAPDDYLVKRDISELEERILLQQRRIRHHYQTIISGLEEQIEALTSKLKALEGPQASKAPGGYPCHPLPPGNALEGCRQALELFPKTS